MRGFKPQHNPRLAKEKLAARKGDPGITGGLPIGYNRLNADQRKSKRKRRSS